MTQKKDSPKVFISYSWQPVTNKNWVIDFAERLTRDGVHVIIDEWDASEGEDKYVFMEKMVNDEEIEKVLLICNKEYAQKANKKKGGVGIESQIISNDIYKKVDQKKFIPIVKEYIDNEACLPTFVSNRFYIDLSNEDSYEESYEQLLRNIFNKPKSSRPPLGRAPTYIIDNDPIFIKTAHKIKPMKDALIKDKSNSQAFVQEYIDSFIDSIIDFKFPDDFKTERDFDEEIINKISELRLLRDDFIEFAHIYITYSPIIEKELFHRLFEKILENVPEIIDNTYYTNDHLLYFTNEIFIYTIALLLKKEKYEIAGYLLHNKFLVYVQTFRKTKVISFNDLNPEIKSFEYRNDRLGLKRTSIKADLIKESVNTKYLNFEDLVQADSILYYISCLHYDNRVEHYSLWYPSLYVYFSISNIILFDKMISKRIFEKVRCLLGVKNIDELKSIMESLKEEHQKIRIGYFSRFPSVFNVIKTEEIGTIN